MPRSYVHLTGRSQVARLRPKALEACRLFGLEAPRLRLLAHGFNTTFSVRSGGSRYALRLNTNSVRTRQEICAEVAWTSALSDRSDVHVPRPHRTLEGASMAELEWSELGRPLYAVLYDWLPGRVAFQAATLSIAEELGRATRALHRHALHWSLPPGCALNGLDDILFHKPLRLESKGFRGDTGVFLEVGRRANAVLRRLSAEPRIPIHSDLHLQNLKVHGGVVSVFDFDDCCLGHPLIDVAVSLFYLRRNVDCEGMEGAYWRGLGLAPDELSGDEEREALTAGRALMLCNELFDMQTAAIVAAAPRYAEVTEIRLRHYLDTGRFDPNIASLPR